MKFYNRLIALALALVLCTGSFAVTKECSFDAVAACQHSQLSRCNACSSVIMRVERDAEFLSSVQVRAHVFDL